MTQFPDYRTVPTNRTLAITPEQKMLWLEWGNDHDGPQGEFVPMYPDGSPIQVDDDGYPFGVGLELCQERFERWWMRNPQHNKTMIVDRRPVKNPSYLIGNPGPDPRYEMNRFLVLRTNPFFIKIGPFIYGYRSDKPMWPAPQHWLDRDPTLGPPETHGYGGAMDIGCKSYSYP